MAFSQKVCVLSTNVTQFTAHGSQDLDLNDQSFSMFFNGEQIQGLTALHVCAVIDDLKGAELLVQSGANANVISGRVIGRPSIGHKSTVGYTALHLATIKGSEEMCRLLLKSKANIDVIDYRQRTPLELSLEKPSIVKLLVRSGAKHNGQHFTSHPLIFRAILSQTMETIEYLYETQSQCFYYANQSPIEYAMNVFPNCVSNLISFGKHLHSPNPFTGETLLQTAIRKKNIEWIELLCKHNCDPNLANRAGHRALHIAVQSHCNKEIILVLLSFGANPNLKNPFTDWTPICYAIENGATEVAELLLRYNYRLCPQLSELQKAIQYRRHKTALTLLKDYKQLSNTLTFDSEPIIWYFIKHCVGDNDSDVKKMSEVFNRLIEITADVNTEDSIWGTLMHFLIYAKVCSPAQCYEQLFRVLVASPKCQINKVFVPRDTQTKTGEEIPVQRIKANGTALSFALQMNGCEFFAEELIRVGADINTINWDNIFFAPPKAQALKMLILLGLCLPDWFESYADPIHDYEVPENETEFYAQEFKVFIEWLSDFNTKPLSLKQTSRQIIRKTLIANDCRLSEANGARIFSPDLPSELYRFIRFESTEDLD